MAESKQYITHIQDNGTIMVSEDVIASIVAHAVKDVDGVVGLSTKAVAELADMIGKKNWGKGIKVTITDNNELYLDCNILVYYGYSVMGVANNIQDSVASALESTTGVKVLGVNVNVCGIVR